MIPRATYRLQLHAAFNFADAEAIVPYLSDLGVSHVYASPITSAAPGSMHGYDVVDPTRINPELGGEQGLLSLVAALKVRGMGLIIDIVPNHMGVAGDTNAFWLDVLAKGRASEHARLFDIDWADPIALPVLGAPLGEVIAAGDIELVERDGGLGLQLYGETIYPVRSDDPGAGGSGPAALRALVERQHYRLLYWRMANDCLNWRRFFSINELAGLRVEDEAVFAFTHELYLDLFRRGLIDGVRVDHIDGLSDPAMYCRRLRAALEAADPSRQPYIVLEKILAADEALPADWPVDGTSGYDFMREVSGVIHDPAGAAPLEALWERIGGRSANFAIEAQRARRDVLAWQFEGQLEACVSSFAALASSSGQDGVTRGMLRRAIERLLWIFPVYRTYGTAAGAPPADACVREAARTAMVVPPGESGVADYILACLASTQDGDPALRAEAARRFQQLSAPIAAKGVEDTAFYRHAVLLSGNDVGFEPARLASSIAEFHGAVLRRARDHPHAMLATATHDHKRGEDARARLAVLSAVPDAWQQAVSRWSVIAGSLAQGIDPQDIYILFQALVGAWEGHPVGELLPRILDWQQKALREAKLRSSWEAPDEAYERRCADLAAALLASSDFLGAFGTFMAALEPAAQANSLAQAGLHYLVPGVPDLYQGCELADYSMVDPDNRRPVDYTARQDLLAADKRPPKLQLIANLLAARCERVALRDGGYVPLQVAGRRAEHVVAFARSSGDDVIAAAVAVRLGSVLFGADRTVPAAAWWGDTRVVRGARSWPAAALFAAGVVKTWDGN